MLQLNELSKIIFFPKPVNFHKGIDALAFLVDSELGLKLTPNLFILFSNVRKNRIKILFHDGKNLYALSTRFEHALRFSYQAGVVFNQVTFDRFLNTFNPRKRKI